MHIREGRYLQFIYLSSFERTRGLITDEEMKSLEDELLQNPKKGKVEGGTGGVRKVRVGTDGKGKSGSARIGYLYVEVKGKIYFILAFPKNVQANFTSDQKKQMRSLVARLKKE
jgi:hypothetical protein